MARLVRPWFQLLVERAPVAAFWVGLGATAATALLHAGVLPALARSGVPMHLATVPNRVFTFSALAGYTLSPCTP